MNRTLARLFAIPEMRWAASSAVLFLAGLPFVLLGAPWWMWGPLYAACYVTGGWEPALAGLRALRDKTLDVDLLMVVAALGAAAIGEAVDGALLIVIFATSGALEAFATARTEESVRGLLDLTPQTARRSTTGSGRERRENGELEETVPAGDLLVGDAIVIRPGERIGADGVVVTGGSEVDQATITGEPLPVDKTPGDEVFAGTLNGTGLLRVRVTRPAADSVVARIARLVEQAARTKATTQLFIEKFEQKYSVGMVVATVLLFAIPLVFGSDLHSALLRAMTFMIVASPCAVVLATMPPLLAAIANAGRRGILVKSAVVMEQLGATTTVALDKTGTLTRGTPRVVAVHPAAVVTPVGEPAGPTPGSRFDADHADGIDEVLRLAASAESGSEHPLASAITSAAAARGLALSTPEAFAATPGVGIRAVVDGRAVEVGRSAAPPPMPPGTVVEVRVDGGVGGWIAIGDDVRPEAKASVTELTCLLGAPPVLLTGDNRSAALAVADPLGIGEVRAGLRPEEKVTAVRELVDAGHRVTVVGDGVNDAPALATAHAGIAMGRTGSDLAIDSADAVVVDDDLTTVPGVIRLARRARRVVIANLAIAGTFIAVLVAWDIFGHLPLPLGVLGHEGSTVLVGLNGLRLLRATELS